MAPPVPLNQPTRRISPRPAPAPAAAPKFTANPAAPPPGPDSVRSSGGTGDDEDTFPLPVILPDRQPEAAPESGHRPADKLPPLTGPEVRVIPRPSEQDQAQARGFFELPPQQQRRQLEQEISPAGGAIVAGHEPADTPGTGERLTDQATGETGDTEALSKPSEKMEQIKDLYLTAEAIGDDALSQYFQQVSERQRQLIREYFDEKTTGGTEPGPLA